MIAILAAAILNMGQAPTPTTDLNPSPIPDSSAALEPWRGDEWVFGQDSAPVTVVEYLSDTCAHCAAFDREVFPYVRDAYIQTGRVRYIVRELLTPPTELAAVGFLLARCSGEGRYLATVQDLMRHQDALFHGGDPRRVLLEIGERAGLAPPQIEHCLADPAALSQLNDRVQTAATQGIEGTPTFVINGRKLTAGDRIGGGVYEGGELTSDQFDAAFRGAMRRLEGRRAPYRPPPRAKE